MSYMFNGALAFNKGITGWNTGNVTNMQSMFENAQAFNALLYFNTGKVINFNNMFKNAITFNLSISTFIFTPSLITTASMFEGASSYNQSMLKSTILSPIVNNSPTSS